MIHCKTIRKCFVRFIIGVIILAILFNSLFYCFIILHSDLLKSRHLNIFKLRLSEYSSATQQVPFSADRNLILLEKDLKDSGNIPMSYSNSNKSTVNTMTKALLSRQNNCTVKPNLTDLLFNNDYWQIVSSEGGVNSTIIYAYGAYLDIRVDTVARIRILIDTDDYLLVSRIRRKPKFCQIWYTEAVHAVISKVERIEYLWPYNYGHFRHGLRHPFLVTCKVPRIKGWSYSKKNPPPKKGSPESVSLVLERCAKSTNNLKINYIVPSKKEDFGVCVRWLDFPDEDLSLKLIEWIEMIVILGAAKIHFNIMAIHPNAQKVLEYYEEKGRVTFKQYKLPGYQPNLPRLRNNYLYYKPNRGLKMWRQEVIAYNDCFYTYMYSYKHIAMLDIDEVILPVSSPDWMELLKLHVQDSKISQMSSYCYNMVVFTQNLINGPKVNISKAVPSGKNETRVPFMMKQLNTSSVCSSQESKKCFFSTSNVLQVYNHRPLKCLFEPCTVTINRSVAYVHHHRTLCDLKRFTYNRSTIYESFTYDPTILKYNDKLSSQRDEAVKEIGLSNLS